MDRERIFLADDSNFVRESLRALLTAVGHTVAAEAANVPLAIGIVKNPDVDFRVALVDGQMPDQGDGEKIAASIRETRPETVIVSLSARPQTFGDHNLSKLDGPEALVDLIQGLK